MEVIITPDRRIGPVRIGMTRAEIRAVLAGPVDVFRRNAFADTETDYFTSIGIQVDYDQRGICNLITATEEAEPRYENNLLVGIPIGDCKECLDKYDPDIETEDSGFRSKKLGIGVYAPNGMLNTDDLVEAIYIFADGYYE